MWSKLRIAAAAAMFASGMMSGIGNAWAEAGDLLVRFRGIGVVPTAESGGILPALANSRLQARPSYVPELDFTYFFTDNIAAELILATTRHQIEGRGGIGNLGNVADAWLLPPTLTLQYHFNPEGRFQPYVGAGINLTFFYGEDADGALEAVVGRTAVDATTSLGWALQAGLDYKIAENWYANFDVKYVHLDTNVTLNTAGAGVQRADLNINPLIIGIGIGYRFNLF